jgi:hypothetical protein
MSKTVGYIVIGRNKITRGNSSPMMTASYGMLVFGRVAEVFAERNEAQKAIRNTLMQWEDRADWELSVMRLVVRLVA